MNKTYLENSFTGRKEILALLEKRFDDFHHGYRQNVALLGQQFIGKSTVLRQFVKDVDDANTIVVYLDLESKDSSYFFTKFITTLLYRYAKANHIPLHEDMNLLVEATKQDLPKTTEQVFLVQAMLAKGKIDDAYRTLVALPEIFTHESGLYCVLIIDEFHILEEYELEKPFQILGDQIMTQKKCWYVLSSSAGAVASKILSEKLSLLFGNFESIHLGEFDFKTSLQFIDNNMDDLRMGLQLKNFLVDFTGGHPLYLDLIVRELVSLSAVHQQKEIYLPLLIQTIENVIFYQWGILSRHFELIVNKVCAGRGNRMVSSLLIALSNGHRRAVELVDVLGIKQAQVSQRLNRLIDQGFVTKNGSYHYITDKLLRYWIKYVYQRRLCAIDLEPGRERRQFKDDLNKLLLNFQTMSRKDFSARMVDLLHSFDNETLQINGRKYKLPVFSSIGTDKIRHSSGSQFDLIHANCEDGEWMLVLKKDSLLEQDVAHFVSHSKVSGSKPRRCVIVSMSDIDETAKVRAFQERMWVWNEKELNSLMDLFDKPLLANS